MKLSVSLTAQDVAALDRFVEQAGLESRSAGVQRAIRALPDQLLSEAYSDAWDEWTATDDAALWAGTSGDGITDAAR